MENSGSLKATKDNLRRTFAVGYDVLVSVLHQKKNNEPHGAHPGSVVMAWDGMGRGNEQDYCERQALGLGVSASLKLERAIMTKIISATFSASAAQWFGKTVPLGIRYLHGLSSFLLRRGREEGNLQFLNALCILDARRISDHLII